MVSDIKNLWASHPNRLFLLMAALITFLRFWNYHQWFVFDADQESLSLLVRTIVVDRHPLLIGMPTSVGGMFIGPLLVYLLIPFYLAFQMQPTAQVFFTAITSFLFIFSLGFVTNKFFGIRASVITIILYGCSWLLTIFDRTFWNPSLIPLAVIWLIYFVCRYYENFPKRRYLLFAALCGGATFHLHFVSLIAYAFLILSWVLVTIIKRRLDFQGLAIVVGVAIVSLLPLIVFDFRHNFLISHNFVQFMLHGANSSDTIIKQIPLLTRVTIFFSILGTSIYNHSSASIELLTVAILLILLARVFLDVKTGVTGKVLLELLFFILAFLLLIVFLKSNTPILPYYFLIIFPLWTVILGSSIERFMSKKTSLIIPLMGIFLFLNLPELVNSQTDLNLENKTKVVRFIINDSAGKSFKVDFINDPGLKTGFDYLFWVNGKKLIEDQTVVTENSYKIVVPHKLAPRSEIKKIIGPYGIIKK